jgi:hypothetical protein
MLRFYLKLFGAQRPCAPEGSRAREQTDAVQPKCHIQYFRTEDPGAYDYTVPHQGPTRLARGTTRHSASLERVSRPVGVTRSLK